MTGPGRDEIPTERIPFETLEQIAESYRAEWSRESQPPVEAEEEPS